MLYIHLKRISAVCRCCREWVREKESMREWLFHEKASAQFFMYIFFPSSDQLRITTLSFPLLFLCSHTTSFQPTTINHPHLISYHAKRFSCKSESENLTLRWWFCYVKRGGGRNGASRVLKSERRKKKFILALAIPHLFMAKRFQFSLSFVCVSEVSWPTAYSIFTYTNACVCEKFFFFSSFLCLRIFLIIQIRTYK